MTKTLASGSVTLYDQNDAIISGEKPVSPAVDALWIDTSVTPNMMKRYDGVDWKDVAQLDATIVTSVAAIQSTLSNMADDSKLDFKDRQKLKENIAEIIGTLLGDTEAMPTVTVLDALTEGSFTRNRRAAKTAGILTTDTNYVALTNMYNTLRNYLGTHTPKSWDTSLTNKDAVIAVTKATFRQHWLNYYNAELALAESATTFLSSGLSTLKDTTLPALQDKMLSEAEKTAIRSSLMLTQKEKKDIDAIYASYNSNANLLNKTVISTPYTAYATAYSETITAINNVLAVATGTTIPTSLITAVNTKFTTYADNLALLRAALQTAQKTIEAKIVSDTASNLFTELSNYVTALDLSKVQDQVDGSITTHFGSVEPTTSNAPVTSWTTTTLKDTHLGDLYYDDVTGYSYRFSKKNGVYSWIRITDSDITLALDMASKAQDTADGKRRMFVTTPQPPYDIGDLWAGDTSSDLMRATISRASGSYVSSDWSKAVKYTDDTTASAAQQAAVTAKGVADGAATSATTANNLLSDIASDSKLTAAEKSSLKVQWDSILTEFESNKTTAAAQGVSSTDYHNAYTSLSGTIGTHLNDAYLKVTTSINGTTLRAAFKSYYDQRQILLNAITDALNQKSIDLGVEVGKATSDDKTEILSGNPVFTDKSDDAIVHVGVDGLSVQNAGSGKNMLAYMELGGVAWATGLDASLTDRIRSNYIPVSLGDVVSYSENGIGIPVAFYEYDINKQPLDPRSNGVITYTLKNSGVAFVRIIRQSSTNVNAKSQLEKSSTVSSYEFPAPSPDYPIAINSLDKSFDIGSSVGGRNFIKGSNKFVKASGGTGTTSSITSLGEIKIVATASGNLAHSFILEGDVVSGQLKENDSFTVSITMKSPDVSSVAPSIYVRPNMGYFKLIGNIGTEYSILYYSGVWKGDTSNLNIHLNLPVAGIYFVQSIKIEKGGLTPYSQAPEDIQHNTQSPTLYKTNILLSEPLRSVGDVHDRVYLDSLDNLWKVERNVKEKVINGLESWNSYIVTPNSVSLFTQNFTDMAGNGDYSSNLFNTISKESMANTGSDTEGISGDGTNNRPYLFIKVNKSRLLSLDSAGLKAWLVVNPATIQYELATPTIETLSAEQQNYLNNIASFKDSNYVYTVANLTPNLRAQFKSTAFYRYKQSVSTINNLRQSMDTTKDVNIGMLIGYSSFSVQTTNSLYFCGLKTNESTFNEEVADIDGSIFNRQTKATIVVPKQAISLAGVPAGTSGYIIWDNTSKLLHFTYYTSVMGTESKTSSSWKNQAGASINLTDSVYVIGEIEVS